MLEGVRVVQLASLLPGPLCCKMLMDMGAEVVMIERPHAGDPLRAMLLGPDLGGPMFSALNAGKSSLVCDVTKPTQVEQLHSNWLCPADVLVLSVRPGSLDACGLGVDTLRQRHPHLIVCCITGYGLTGPLAKRAGHDLNYVARSGVLGMSAGEHPRPLPVQVADVAGGAYAAALQITAALVKACRDPQGCARRGCLIDVSMTDVSASLLIGSEPLRVALDGVEDMTRGGFPLCGGVPCYDVYPTKDGRHVVIGALEAPYWRKVIALLSLPDEFQSASAQYAMGSNGDAIRQRIAAATRQRTWREWCDVLEGVDVMMDPVFLPGEAARSAHFRHRFPSRPDPSMLPGTAVGIVGSGAECRGGGTAPQLGSTPLTDSWKDATRRPPPSKL